MQSRACKKNKTVTAPNKVRDVMKGGIASTWINLDQPASTCINLHQPASTSINLHKPASTSINKHQPASEEIPLTIGTPHVARPDVVFLRRDRREIDIGQKHGHPILLWVVGVCPPRREKRKEPVSLVILVTAAGQTEMLRTTTATQSDSNACMPGMHTRTCARTIQSFGPVLPLYSRKNVFKWG